MKSTYQRKSLMYAHPVSVEAITKMFLKVGKRRIMLYVLTGMVFFAIFTSVNFVLNSYKMDLYQKYSEENANWFDDEKFSVTGKLSAEAAFNNNIQDNFLETIFSKFLNQYYSFLPKGAIQYSTSLAAIELYATESEISCALNFLDESSSTLIPNYITQGRMPENETEILYYKSGNSESQFTIDENILLKTYTYNSMHSHNYTIVGVIENLGDAFALNNESRDVLHWRKYVPDTAVAYQFYTTASLFEVAVQKWHPYKGIIIVADFYFDWTIMNYRKMFHYQNKMDWEKNYYGHVIFYYDKLYDPEEGKVTYNQFSWGDPLYNKLAAFNNYYVQESIRILAISIPVLSLIFFTCLESFNIDAQKLKTTFLILKKYGVKYKPIRKVLLTEGVLTIAGSFIGGCCIGILGGFILAVVQNYQITFLSFLGGLLLPFYWTLICAFALFFFISNFLTEKEILKEIEYFKAKEPKKTYQKLLEKIYSYPEGRLLLPGIITTTLGFFGLFLCLTTDTVFTEFYSVYLVLLLISYALLFVGIIMLVGIVCWFLARILTKGISFLGKKLWQWKKTKITLSLKNFVGNNKDYRRFFFVNFLTLICIIPGLVIGVSSRNYMNLESTISNGCTDLVVVNWMSNETIETELNTRDDIVATTEVTLYRYSYSLKSMPSSLWIDYTIFILGIHDPKNFSQIIAYKQLGDVSYSQNQIRALENDSTYLMSELYASRNGYDANETILYNSQICQSSYQFPLIYISSYEYFPLVPIQGRDPLSNNRFKSFSLVTNYETAKDIMYVAREEYTKITEESYLMIKTVATATEEEQEQTKEELKTLYQMEFTTDREENRAVLDTYNSFLPLLLVIITLVVIAILVFYGIFTSQIIFQKRMKITETQFRLGVNRKQIWWGFTIENLLITILPVIISAAIAYLVLRQIDRFLVIKWLLYNQFSLWLPLWFVLLVSFVDYLVINCVWGITLIRPIKQYRPIKQE